MRVTLGISQLFQKFLSLLYYSRLESPKAALRPNLHRPCYARDKAIWLKEALLFEAVVNVLEKDYGVPVIKKPSGKSSRKTRPRIERGNGLPPHGPQSPGLLQRQI